MKFGPADTNEEMIFAVEEFRAEIQYAILRRLKERGLTQAQLAQRLRVSPAWVSQVLSDDANLTAETIARGFFALDAECKLAVEPVAVVAEPVSVPDFVVGNIGDAWEGTGVGLGLASYSIETWQFIPTLRDNGDRRSVDTAQMLLHAIQQNCKSRPMMVANDHHSRQKIKRVTDVAA